MLVMADLGVDDSNDFGCRKQVQCMQQLHGAVNSISRFFEGLPVAPGQFAHAHTGGTSAD
jgi:hypothetical protein